MGLVTRKDLARYHLGKHGLEEMDLAHPWPSPSLRRHWGKSGSVTPTVCQQSQCTNSKLCSRPGTKTKCDEPSGIAMCVGVRRSTGVSSSFTSLSAVIKGSGWIVWSVFACPFARRAPFTLGNMFIYWILSKHLEGHAPNGMLPHYRMLNSFIDEVYLDMMVARRLMDVAVLFVFYGFPWFQRAFRC